MEQYNKVLLGHVGVDSGQLLLCDPCYIESEWEQEDFTDVRVYQHKTTGDKLQYRVDFPNYGAVIPKYGKTMNELNATGEWEQIEDLTTEHNFSYNACSKATLSKKRAGQLNYKHGHEGVGVAFSTAFGDGFYPVFQNYDDQGELISVEVVFQFPEDDEDEEA
jgi:hypothetical protein